MDRLTLWVGFGLIVAGMMLLDLGVFHRRARESTFAEAVGWSLLWIFVSLAFAFVIFKRLGSTAGLEFMAAYLIEKALSVDNLFVFFLIFTAFSVRRAYQHRILFWGVLGALVLRGTVIGAGVYLIQTLHWMIYAFGAFLVLAGLRLLRSKDDELLDPSDLPVLRVARRLLPVVPGDHGGRFFVRSNTKNIAGWAATQLLVVLILVETTDLVFALDSIPAAFGVTTDPFLVYSSNVCAVLGLRALYFVLARAVAGLRYLRAGLAAVLSFVGAKMLLSGFIDIPIGLSFAVIGSILLIVVIASLRHPAPKEATAHAAAGGGPRAAD